MEEGEGGASIDPSTIEGLNDQIVTDIFDEPVVQGVIPSGSFIEPEEKDTVVSKTCS